MTLTVPRVHHLVSRVEIADMLGVSRQRLHQIIAAGGFPEPVANLGIGQVWERAAVRRWVHETGRAPMLDDDEE